jgi:hypothetical protein
MEAASTNFNMEVSIGRPVPAPIPSRAKYCGHGPLKAVQLARLDIPPATGTPWPVAPNPGSNTAPSPTPVARLMSSTTPQAPTATHGDDLIREIASEINGLTKATRGTNENAERLGGEIEAAAKIVPTLQRLTEIVDPLDTTVVRLERFVDRLPGSGRRAVKRGASTEEL